MTPRTFQGRCGRGRLGRQGLVTLLMTGLSLGGCSESSLRGTASPPYDAGYRDGCQTGTSKASNLTGVVVRDEARYLADPEYASGWRNGERNCNGQNLSTSPTDPMQPVDVDGPTYGPSN